MTNLSTTTKQPDEAGNLSFSSQFQLHEPTSTLRLHPSNKTENAALHAGAITSSASLHDFSRAAAAPHSISTRLSSASTSQLLDDSGDAMITSQDHYEYNTSDPFFYRTHTPATIRNEDHQLFKSSDMSDNCPRTFPPPYDPRLLPPRRSEGDINCYEPDGFPMNPQFQESYALNCPAPAPARSIERLSVSQSPRTMSVGDITLKEDSFQMRTPDAVTQQRVTKTPEDTDGDAASPTGTVLDGDDPSNDEPYAKLIYRALMSVPSHSMVLQDIYRWFLENTDKGSQTSSGWKNSIRHNLSMNAAFKKTERRLSGDDSKKSTEWVLEPFAIKEGVKSTTRYRKVLANRKSSRSENPAPLRQSSGRKGGLKAGQTKSMRLRAAREQEAWRRHQQERLHQHQYQQPQHLEQHQHQPYQAAGDMVSRLSLETHQYQPPHPQHPHHYQLQQPVHQQQQHPQYQLPQQQPQHPARRAQPSMLSFQNPHHPQALDGFSDIKQQPQSPVTPRPEGMSGLAGPYYGPPRGEAQPQPPQHQAAPQAQQPPHMMGVANPNSLSCGINSVVGVYTGNDAPVFCENNAPDGQDLRIDTQALPGWYGQLYS